jgi:hypothetical protein
MCFGSGLPLITSVVMPVIFAELEHGVHGNARHPARRPKAVALDQRRNDRDPLGHLDSGSLFMRRIMRERSRIVKLILGQYWSVMITVWEPSKGCPPTGRPFT